MTLNTTTTKVSYAGTGAQTVFPVTFKFLQNSHVTAILRDASGNETVWVEGSQYNLTGAGDESGGDLTVETVPVDHTPANGETLVIKRTPPETQGSALPLGGAFSSALVEQALDLLTMQVQAHSEEIARAVLLKATSAESGITIPDPKAASFIRWDALAQNLENADITGAGSISIPVSVAQGGTSATTAASARTNLGLEIGSDVNAFMATVPQAEAEVGSASTRRAWTAERDRQAIEALAMPRSYFAGLQVSNNAVDADHDVDVAVGECRDNASNTALRLVSPITKRIDAPWAEGTNQGGLNTGVVAADTWYDLYLIRRSDTGHVDAIFTAAPTAPLLPANYDSSLLIRSELTDSSANIIPTIQTGRWIEWKKQRLDWVGITTQSTTSVLRKVSAPLGRPTTIRLSVAVSDASSDAVLITSPLRDDEAYAYRGRSSLAGTSVSVANVQEVLTDALSQVRTRGSGAVADFSLGAFGYWDHLGGE